MNDYDRPTDTRSRSDRRRLLKSGGVLAGAAALFGGAPAAAAADRASSAITTRRNAMPTWKPDPTFYPSPRSAMQAPAETLAYVVRVNPTGDDRPDAITVVDVDPTSSAYGQLVGEVAMTHPGDELHHFGWNACSSMLCPNAPHPHVERRYLIAPGLGSSRIYIIDTKPDPTRPQIVKTIEPEEVAAKTGYANGHTVHCGPDGIYVSALGAPDGEGPGGIFMLDHDTFDVLGRWEIDRGAQYLHYDFWWHLGYDTLVSSEWGTPKMVQSGIQPDLLLDGQYGHRLHVWHRKANANGAADGWDVTKVITIPAEPAEEDQLPPALKPFQAVPPLVTDIELSVDDQFLYVSCWGTGELKQFDVSDPFEPKETGSVRIGGIVDRAPHPGSAQPLNGGPQMVEVSRDGRRVYVTNSLYLPWDAQFYPDGIQGWMVKLDADPAGGMSVDPNFFLDFGDQRPHQVRLQGGDASTDSYCYS